MIKKYACGSVESKNITVISYFLIKINVIYNKNLFSFYFCRLFGP